MRQGDDPAAIRVAEAITDGTPVDWKTAQPALGDKVEHLRLIEEVARAHRTPFPAPRPASADRTVSGGASDLLTTAVPPPAGPWIEPSVRPAGEVPLSTWGPLRILERLDRGGFGDVYRAFDPALQREVALKLRRLGRGSDDLDARRFLKEGRRLARVRHPNVLVVHGIDRHDGRVGIWTDLLGGRTLEQLLTDQGAFGAHEAALVGIDLCRALAAVHAAGLIHRDLKTRNVMREQGGRIVLMDFGSVAERPRAGGEQGNEEPGSGTPLFMAPEHLLTDQPATPASDIYSLGVVLYRLVSGRFPVEAETMAALIEKHRAGAPVSLRDVRSDLPTAFVQVVERALDPDPGRRFQTAGAMERALAASVGLAGVAEASVVDRIAGASGRSRMRCWLMRAAWVVGSAAAVAAALVLLHQVRSTTRPFTVDAALFRLEPGAEERLEPGGRVGPGDRLFLEVQSPEKTYMYVLNADQKGEVFVLFPAGLDLTNPLAPGVRHRLPGSAGSQQMTWEVTSAGGKERFLVIASRRPLRELEHDIAQLPRAKQGRQVAYAPMSPDSFEALRGIGGLAPAPSSASGAGEIDRLWDLARSLSTAAARQSGIWTWEIQLENPG